MFASNFRVRTHSIFLTVAMLAALLFAPPSAIAADPVPGADFTLTILHNNDGESQLINAGSGLEDFGGIARFKTLVDGLRADAIANGNGVLMLSSGDNFLAGPEFNASIENGIPYYDALGIEAIGYDAISLGNHDFDFGPDTLANFLSSYSSAPQYLNANLDFSGEPGLQAFVDSGVIAPSTVVTTGGEDIGIVGAITPGLRSISSPRGVVIDFDVAGAIQAEIDTLTAAGVNKIVIISHLQSIDDDIELAAQLTGVDVMIAGGGDELLANPGDPLVPGEEDDVFGAYPLTATGGDGASVPIVTTPGEYKYLGQLSVGFDSDGNVVGVGTDSGPKVVDGTLTADAAVQAAVVDPVIAALATLDSTVIGTSEVTLDGTRATVRSVESNEGNLIADALWWQATELAADFGVNPPDVALQNGGGIRNNVTIPAGDITLLDTFDSVPFSNFVTIVPDIPRWKFRNLLENAISNVPGDGRFAQVSGFSFTYDTNGIPMNIDDETGEITQLGTRIVNVTFDDGTEIVKDGVVIPGDRINIATIDFLARGGDEYPYVGAPFTSVGVSYQQAMANYIVDGLNGLITAADYPEGGEGRITAVDGTVDGPFTPIYEVQGSGDASPLDGQNIEIEGTVTGAFADLGGFYLQETVGDGDATTSDGVFVESDATVTAGAHAAVLGVVNESFGETRVTAASVDVTENGAAIVPAEVSLPLGEGASLEAYEGMLITFPDYLFVSDTFNLHRFGEALMSAGGVLVNPTNIAEPGDAANAVAAANTARSIVLDDGSGAQFPDTVPYTVDGQRRRGDAAKGITANLSFSFGAYKLQPTEDVVFVEMNPRPASPDPVGGNVTVASFNVLNFFSTIDDGENGARGADSDAEKAAQLTKLVAAINGLGADIIGLQEIENNGPVAIGELIDALNADNGEGTWAAAADPDYPGGLEATNAIKVAIIFKPASVTPVGATEVSEDPVFAADRPAIAHSFEANGDTFTVINNHFKSKSSRDAEGLDLDQGDGQGAYNARRTAQANALIDFTLERVTEVGDDDVLVIGDFNSYPLEDPIIALDGAMNNLVKDRLSIEDSYSLVFFGAQGLLDGAFATDSLEEKVTGIDIWHINADETRVLQYNDDVVDPAERSSDFNQPLSQPDVYSSSDHDAVVVGLQLGDPDAGPISLAYSASNDRKAPVALEGATVSGKIYPFVEPLDPGLGFTTVDFYLDGEHARTEYLAPYDFAGGLLTMATAFETSQVADGAHTIKASGNLPDGSTVETTATFMVDNAPTMTEDFTVAFSDSEFRTDPAMLEGAFVRGNVYPFVYPLFPDGFESYGRVSFYLDGEAFHTEYQAPYDFVSGGIAKANEVWDTTALEDGAHTITVKAHRDGATPLMATVSFTVSNDTEPPPPPPPPPPEPIRFATYNASLNRFNAGDLVADLSTPDNAQAKVIAEVIQRTRPEVLLLNEFDYDVDGEGARLFQENYLAVSQNGAEPIVYGYAFSAPSNTGVASGLDLDNSGDVGGPGDAFGFGFFEGQFGMQVYSQYPIDFANVRTFQNFLWADMPGALLPVDPATGEGWYSDEELESFRLSSKSHWDVPIVVGDGVVNFLVSHPTPPVFDGPEDRNGTRNSDEIRFWSDYVNEAAYMYDDNGGTGGWSGDYFVIAGDQNSDPNDGDSLPDAITQLLDVPRVNTTMTPSSLGAVEQDGLQGGANLAHLSDPAFDTADFNDNPAPGNLRADYVLPSNNLSIADSGVFWPESTDPLFPLVGTFPFPSSDHRLVWVDLLPGDEPLADPVLPLPSIFDIASGDDRFETLTAAVELAGLEGALDQGGPFTVLAPTDDAFDALPPGLLDDALADPGFLEAILLYHVIEGAVPAEVVVTLTEATTLLGAPISIEVIDGAVIINGTAEVIITDIEAANGIIHVIDAVLLPPPPPEPLGFLASAFGRGSTVVPGPGDSTALHNVFIDVFEGPDGTAEVCFFANTSVQDPTVAHIHRGAAGEAGPVVVDTGFTADSWTQDQFVPIVQFAEGCVDVERDLALEMIADPGGFHFNVHSGTNPNGATREQLVDADGVPFIERGFTAAPLLGSNVVPGPGDPDSGRGFVDVLVPATDNGEWCYSAVIFRVGEITSGHIHIGAAGEAGGVLVDLEMGSRWAGVLHPSGQGWEILGCVAVSAEAQSQIAANPAGFHVNVHNAEFPDGAVRAQLVAGVGEVIRIAELFPPDGFDPNVNGFADLALFPSQGLLCWDTPNAGIGEPTGMSISDATGLLISFDLVAHPFLAVTVDPFFEYTSFGCQALDSATIDAIVANPNDFTFQIDSADATPALTGVLFDPQLGPPGPPGPPPEPDVVELQILAINDFHGNIATTSSAFGGVGRADYLSANMAAAEFEADNSIIVSAGDLIGASPLISALFHDEPTIEAMNLIGLEINGVGNHEFDEGADELLRMANGGSHPVDGDLDGDGFAGADFEFLAANVVDDASGDTIFAPYTVKEYEGVKVAFIGMTLEGTPSIVTPSGVAGLTFNDEVDTVNALIPEIQGQGIEAIVVLLHEGGIASEGGGDGDGCGTLSGNLYDIVVGLDDAVDLVIGGHNNQRFVCPDVDGKAVTMAYWSGRMFTDIDTVLDKTTGEMTIVAIDNKENFQEGVTPDADVTALIDKYEGLAAPLANQVIGSITTDIPRTRNDAGESALGDVIADAQLAATTSAATGGAVIAFMNPGGIRGDMLFADVGGPSPGEVSFGEAFRIQPFGNSLVTMTLSGAQIRELLTQQWSEPDDPSILQVSNGFTYTWDANVPVASRVDASSMMLNGVMIDAGADYRVTVNSFLADGGDGFSVLTEGTDRLGGEVDLDALVTYFGANSPIAPGPQDRITRVEGTPPAPVDMLLSAELSGPNEVPGPGDPNGSGTADMSIVGTTLSWIISVALIGDIQAGHIHEGDATVAGPAFINMDLGPVVFVDDGTGTYSAAGSLTITEEQAQAVAANPGGFYLNLHTPQFPAGAIRGQLVEPG